MSAAPLISCSRRYPTFRVGEGGAPRNLWGPLGLAFFIWTRKAEVGWELASGPAWVLPSRAPAVCLSQGGGCALMNRLAKFQQIVRGMNQVLPKMTAHSPHRPT